MKDGDEWQTITRRKPRYQQQPLNVNGSEVYTLFVSNIREGCTTKELWKGLQHLGKIVDSFIPKKKDRNNKTFGFVHFADVIDTSDLIAKINDTTILGLKLSANLARYSKEKTMDGNEMNNNNVSRGRNDAYKPLRQVHEPFIHPTSTATWPKPNGIPYQEVATGGKGMECRMIHIPDKGFGLPSSYQAMSINRALIGDLRYIESIPNIHNILKDDMLEDYDVSYGGGVKVMIRFKTNDLAVNFLNEKKQVWDKHFKNLVVWQNQEFTFERLVALRIHGVPIMLKDGETYDRIAGEYGKLIEKSKFSWCDYDVPNGLCFILSNSGEIINEKILLYWKNKQNTVWVHEESIKWNFVGEEEKVDSDSGVSGSEMNSMYGYDDLENNDEKHEDDNTFPVNNNVFGNQASSDSCEKNGNMKSQNSYLNAINDLGSKQGDRDGSLNFLGNMEGDVDGFNNNNNIINEVDLGNEDLVNNNDKEAEDNPTPALNDLSGTGEKTDSLAQQLSGFKRKRAKFKNVNNTEVNNLGGSSTNGDYMDGSVCHITNELNFELNNMGFQVGRTKEKILKPKKKTMKRRNADLNSDYSDFMLIKKV